MSEKFPWRTGRSCIFKNHIHLVFVTKYRRNVFTDKILLRLEELLLETCLQMGAELMEFNREDDHVHLLVSCPPKLAVSNLVQKLKGKSSYFLRREFLPDIKDKLWGNHFWSPSYCVVSCGGAPLETVRQYIEEQRRPPKEKQIERSKRFAGRKRSPSDNWKWEERR